MHDAYVDISTRVKRHVNLWTRKQMSYRATMLSVSDLHVDSDARLAWVMSKAERYDHTSKFQRRVDALHWQLPYSRQRHALMQDWSYDIYYGGGGLLPAMACYPSRAWNACMWNRELIWCEVTGGLTITRSISLARALQSSYLLNGHGSWDAVERNNECGKPTSDSSTCRWSWCTLASLSTYW
jgi:hypothetical protein